MFHLSTLPEITFLGADCRRTLVLSQCGLRIKQIAETVALSAPPTRTVGIIYQTGPDLVLAWLGVLAAGRVPLILQYPNEKVSTAYWNDSLRNTIAQCNVGALLCAPDLSAYAPEQLAPCLFLHSTEDVGNSNVEVAFPSNGAILQLSSGTTGFKKPVRLDFDAVRKHTLLYNEVLRLTADDRIASWLPLYHDMGFIACFVMPLMLGVPVVMMDPITWVRSPRLLFDAVQHYGATVCYMPNFGFAVMARLGISGPFPTMRRWVSCSEPTHSATLERFTKATGAAPATLSICYGMAENVFAVSQSDGMRVFERDARQYVSCGRPIPGTEVKEVNGEFFVRSPHALVTYEGGADIRDKDGFYATGDLGFLEDGEVVVTGRKQDLVNIAGRKFLLNDLDYALGTLFPQSAGRIASISLLDAVGGTEQVLFLIEDDRFWEREQSPEPARLIREATGVDWLEVHFVPRHFLTKTSSGKINRKKTLADWTACQSVVHLPGAVRDDERIAEALAKHFPGIPLDSPIQDEVDSLGQLILKLFCEEHGINLASGLTLETIATTKRTADSSKTEVFSIIALVDGWRLGFDSPTPFIDNTFLEAIAAAVGRPVHFEHICVPPTLILFSDLIFHDYFLPKHPDPSYGVISSLLRKIKRASLILIDDEDNFRTPPYCAYPVLDRQFTMHPDADLLGHRMQRYTQNHHLLPRRIVLGRELSPEAVNPTIASLESYLDTPIFKMAFHAEFRTYTEAWDFCTYRDFATDAEKLSNLEWLDDFRECLLAFIRGHVGQWRTRSGEPINRFVLVDSPHFCSFLLNRSAVDFVVRSYNSFCILGLPSSLPYLTQQLDKLRKPYFFASQLMPAEAEYECLVLTGGAGGRMPATTKPAFDFVLAREEGQGGGRPYNVPPSIDELCPPLAACNEQLFRSVRSKYGVLIGNYLLNHTSPAGEVQS